jgi:hypothetical protein
MSLRYGCVLVNARKKWAISRLPSHFWKKVIGVLTLSGRSKIKSCVAVVEDEAKMHLAEIYEDLGDQEKANEYVQKIGRNSRIKRTFSLSKGLITDDEDDNGEGQETESDEGILYDVASMKDVKLLYQKALFVSGAGNGNSVASSAFENDDYLETLRSLYENLSKNGFFYGLKGEKVSRFLS